MKTVYFVMFIFIGFLLIYGLFPITLPNQVKQEVKQEAEVHRHAVISIEGVDIAILKHAEDFNTHFPLHLHRADAIPTLHMEGLPTPLSAFFKSMQISTFGYDVYVNRELKDFDYIFKDGDVIELR